MFNRFLTLVNGVPRLVGAIAFSAGAIDANKIPATAANGRIDLSLLGLGSIVDVTVSRSLALTDRFQFLACNSATAIALTVPTDAIAFAVGDWIEIAQTGTGAVSLSGDTGVTVRRFNSAATTGHTIAGQNAATVLRKIGANNWLLIGGV